MLKYIILILGFVFLIKGADFFVEGCASIAQKCHISALVIGMTIVAMGTSLPETSVSVTAAIQAKNELAISNVIGSNFFNLMVVCGICSLLCPLDISKATLIFDFPFSILIVVGMLVMGQMDGVIGRVDGVILLILFAVFLIRMIISAKKSPDEETEEYKIMSNGKCVLMILLGMGAIALGGNMVVTGASDIARAFGMTENLIGMTIVALGTSLPELVTSVVAARKNQLDMALGNVIGSNVFNILFVLGIATSITPVAFTNLNLIDGAIFVAMSIVVLLFCIPKKKLVRWNGAVMLCMYGGYAAYLFMR